MHRPLSKRVRVAAVLALGVGVVLASSNNLAFPNLDIRFAPRFAPNIIRLNLSVKFPGDPPLSSPKVKLRKAT